jgi:predicted flap endonuclease-1-like 5' DNA nuclease
MVKVLAIEGIGNVYAGKLKAAGVATVERLLKEGARPEGRKALAEKTEISSAAILEWVNRADLMRIKGVGEEYSDLLEASGVDTVPELAQRVARNLYRKLLDTNQAKKLVRKMPTEAQVADWIRQAEQLPRVVEY